ncbi:MAG: WbqC family protein [Thermodesulfobacteriota bacterium]|nr:WbqC family protein [Thermodesulfobacteriota bacterium]
MKKIAIMQPTYLPWVGYFALIDRVDEFIFLDSVQFERRSWQQRNRIKGPSGEMMLTVPVHKAPRDKLLICNAKIDYTSKFVRKHINALQHAYGKTPFFNKYKTIIFDALNKKPPLLADLNIEIILKVAKILGIQTIMLRSSELAARGKKDELLFNICRERDAQIYISPPGSVKYLNTSRFFNKDVFPLQYHKYIPQPYDQLNGDCVLYLAIIDLLFNAGPDSLEIIRSGVDKQ